MGNTEIPKILKLSFENVFWPAAAGNVFWAFCNLIVEILKDPAEIGFGFFARLVVLLSFGFYLTIGWMHLRATRDGAITSKAYWIFETLHLLALTFSAIVAQIQPAFLESFLIFFFAVNGIGHLFGVWKLTNDGPNWVMFGVNSLSLVILVGGGALESQIGGDSEIRILISVVLAFGLWFCFGRWGTFKEFETKL